ncbi:hypothetical protein [Anthocerotibacter panamensis]|uniref:hypothetical protein n=1 Tax=Anthocerotibacter panamensis TaxID=2857077 RepID=UPI001C403947|nr:hypothetical protein [Anthocerotibacter panamensis]
MLMLNLTEIQTVEPTHPGAPECIRYNGKLFAPAAKYSHKQSPMAVTHSNQMLKQGISCVLVYQVERVVLYTEVRS